MRTEDVEFLIVRLLSGVWTANLFSAAPPNEGMILEQFDVYFLGREKVLL